jgi:hypothetical protein
VVNFASVTAVPDEDDVAVTFPDTSTLLTDEVVMDALIIGALEVFVGSMLSWNWTETGL